MTSDFEIRDSIVTHYKLDAIFAAIRKIAEEAGVDITYQEKEYQRADNARWGITKAKEQE